MIEFYMGDLFDAEVEALAHGCNTIDTMNAGISKNFKQRFPSMYKDYQKRCEYDIFLPGSAYLFKNPIKPHVINLATQKDSFAQIEYVDSALKWLADSYKDLKIYSVAMPKIASDLGKLKWNLVRNILDKHFKNSDLLVQIWSLD